MKKTRKNIVMLILCLLCVSMCSAFAGTAAAEESYAAQFGIDVKNNGNNVNISVTLTSNFDVTNGSFDLYYDREILEFVADNGKTDLLKNAIYEVNNDYVDSKSNKALRVAFASAYALPSKSGTIVSLSFKVLKAGELDVSVKNGKLYDNSAILKKYLPSDVSVKVSVAPSEAEGLEPTTDSGYSIKGEFVKGIKPSTKVSDVKAGFTNANVVITNADGSTKADSDLVGTGCKISVLGADSEYTAVVIGDCDGNALIDSTDIILIKRHILSIEALVDAGFEAVDFDDNGQIDSTDYISMKRIVLGIVKL